MKCCTAFLLTVAAVFAIAAAQQPKGLGVSLCLDILGGGCENKNSPISINVEAERNPLLVLRNGFKKFSDTVYAAQNVALDGFSKANATVTILPKTALQLLEKTIQDSQDILYASGSYFLFSLGKALALSNPAARKGLVGASQQIQSTGLNILNEMRIAKALAIQERNIGGNAARQVIEAICLNFQTAVAPLYRDIDVALKQATEAIEYAERNPLTNNVVSQNAAAGTQDSDATAVIAEMNKAAADAMSRGASESKVKQLSGALAGSIVSLAEVALNIRSEFGKIEKLLSGNDPALVVDVFLKDCEDVTEKIQQTFTNIVLDLGSAGANLSENQVQNIFITLVHGNEEVTYASDIAKQKILSSLKYEGALRQLILDAAVQVAVYGKVAFFERIAEAGKMMFNLL